jgi:probable phosphoglycerate mutase
LDADVVQPTARRVLYYVRHGLTDWNVAGRLQGRQDVPLNREGRAQSVRCGQLLRDLFERDGRSPEDLEYISSPLARARETMSLLRATLGLEPNNYRVDCRLAEISFGQWEGLTLEDVVEREPGVIARRDAEKWRFRSPGGESYEQVAWRVGSWVSELTGDAVVAAHGGTARALIAHLRIAPPDEATHRPIDQGVVYMFADDRLQRFE